MSILQDAFISYGRADSKAFAAKLNRRLVEQGLIVWFDLDDIPFGVDYQKQIDDGIDKADNFLFIISPHSVNSPYCRLEIELALKRNKRIIPLMHVEKISREIWQHRNPGGTDEQWEIYQSKGLHSSFPNMHPEIAKINWISFQENVDDFEAAFTELLHIFDRHKSYVHQHTILLTKALEWERHQKRSPYLLIGEERQQAEAWLKIRFNDCQPPCLPIDLQCELITESIKNANNLMSQVFLAYADEERAIAQTIRYRLMREGYTVWTNLTDITTGVDFQEAICRGIEEADNVIYLLSPASLQSDYCQQEVDYALSLHKRIIPILLKTVPADQLPPPLKNLQYIDLTDNQSPIDYENDENQVLKILQQDATYHEDHKILLAKALKWKRQHGNPTMLLRGYNLRYAEAWLKLAQKNVAYPPTPLQEEFIQESLRQPPGMALDVFISYSRTDSGFARKINEALQVQGKQTWFDQESIATGSADFQQEIYRGIESADHFLFILSPSSITSRYCADEVEYAASLNKRFVTILCRSIDVSALHPALAKVQWLDFNRYNQDFSANFKDLIRILDTDPEHLRAHTRLLVRAIEWDNKQRSNSLLLRGDDLEQAEQWLTQAQQKQPQPTELQQDYVQISRSVEDANQKATQILQEAARKGNRRVLIGTIAMTIGLVVAAGASFFAFRSTQVASLERTSTGVLWQIFADEGDDVDLLLISLKNLQDLKGMVRNPYALAQYPTLSPVLALQQMTYRIFKPNRFSGFNRLEGHQGSVNSISFSPDGQQIATASDDGTARLWSRSGQLLHELKGHQTWVYDVSFSPDSQTIATASADRTARLWNRSGQLLHELKGHTDAINSISFSPNGQTIATASNDRTVKLWNRAGTILQTLKHPQAVRSVSFSSDGERLATAANDGMVRLWSLSGALLKSFKAHSEAITSIRFSPDNQIIATASPDRTVKLWTRSGQLLRELRGHRGWVNSVSFSPDGQRLVTASEDGTARVWNIAGRSLQEIKGHRGAINSASFSPDGLEIATASRDKTARLWKQVQTDLKEFQELHGHQGVVYGVSFSPDSQAIATASGDETVRLWNLDGQSLQTFKQSAPVNSVAFSPDGQAIATASYDHIARLWNRSGQLLQEFKGHQGAVSSVSFSPNGQELATGSDDGTARLWKQTGELLQTFTGHQGVIWSVSFSPDGKTLATASDDFTAKLWDRSGKLLQTLVGHQDRVNSIAFSPDGQTLATASDDFTAKLWNRSGKRLQDFKGHKGAVLSVAFSPDGQLLATGSRDGTAKLWSLSGQLLQEFKGHQGAIWSVSFSPNGQWLATASDDGTARVWRVYSLNQLMDLGCDWVRDYLTIGGGKGSDRRICEK
jgi:WD40 repeat protein